jgi:hypothetical protein
VRYSFSVELYVKLIFRGAIAFRNAIAFYALAFADRQGGEKTDH